MKKTVFIAALMSLLFFGACASSNSPEAVAKKAMSALLKGNYDAFADTFGGSPSEKKMMAGFAEEKLSYDISEKGGIKSYKITDVDEGDSSAHVTFSITYKDGTEDTFGMQFEKEDGKWVQTLS